MKKEVSGSGGMNLLCSPSSTTSRIARKYWRRWGPRLIWQPDMQRRLTKTLGAQECPGGPGKYSIGVTVRRGARSPSAISIQAARDPWPRWRMKRRSRRAPTHCFLYPAAMRRASRSGILSATGPHRHAPRLDGDRSNAISNAANERAGSQSAGARLGSVGLCDASGSPRRSTACGSSCARIWTRTW